MRCCGRLGDFLLRYEFEKRLVADARHDHRICAAKNRMDRHHRVGVGRLGVAADEGLHHARAAGDINEVDVEAVLGKKVQIFGGPERKRAARQSGIAMKELRLRRARPRGSEQ